MNEHQIQFASVLICNFGFCTTRSLLSYIRATSLQATVFINLISLCKTSRSIASDSKPFLAEEVARICVPLVQPAFALIGARFLFLRYSFLHLAHVKIFEMAIQLSQLEFSCGLAVHSTKVSMSSCENGLDPRLLLQLRTEGAGCIFEWRNTRGLDCDVFSELAESVLNAFDLSYMHGPASFVLAQCRTKT